jgi:hypothetical protein
MRNLKMVSTEKIFNMLPSVVDLYEKLDIDGYRKKFTEKYKGKGNVDKEIVGIDLFKYILKNSAKVKEEVFEIVAIFEDKSVEEVKAQSFAKTLNTVREIFNDKETISFFKSAVQ